MEPTERVGTSYEVERRARHLERPGFWISELQISPVQEVPWHFHTAVCDTFYVLEGQIRIAFRNPEEQVLLTRGETAVAHVGRPHRVTNAGHTSATFLVLQGFGAYDFVPSP